MLLMLSCSKQAIGKVLPECHLVSAAIDCSTKSRVREIKLSGGRGPRPLRSTQFPRGLPQLAVHEASRVASDNACSDFLLAVQHVLAEHGRGAFRENPSNSLHWDDPVEQVLNRSGDWSDFHYFACVFLAPATSSTCGSSRSTSVGTCVRLGSGPRAERAIASSSPARKRLSTRPAFATRWWLLPSIGRLMRVLRYVAYNASLRSRSLATGVPCWSCPALPSVQTP